MFYSLKKSLNLIHQNNDDIYKSGQKGNISFKTHYSPLDSRLLSVQQLYHLKIDDSNYRKVKGKRLGLSFI